MKAQCVIADDEPLAVQLLSKYVKEAGSLELVSTCANAVEVVSFLHRQPIDLLFLDIQMPKLNGLELLKILNPAPAVIITTAHREYALDGYEFDVVDYLIKPISFERFLSSVEKFYKRTSPKTSLTTTTSSPDIEKWVFLHSGTKTYQIKESDIIFIESLKDYIRLHLVGSKKVLIKYRISQLEEKLSTDFIRIHKSYIIHKHKVTVFSNQAVELGIITLPVGGLYRSSIEKAFIK